MTARLPPDPPREITLRPGVDLDLAQVLVQNRVGLAGPVLPAEHRPPGLRGHVPLVQRPHPGTRRPEKELLPVRGERGDVLPVTLRRTTANRTKDQILWSLVRERTGALSFVTIIGGLQRGRARLGG